jgi:hypothetical protein
MTQLVLRLGRRLRENQSSARINATPWRYWLVFSHGIAEDTLVLAHGFDRAMIAGPVHEGLATAMREVVTGPGSTTIEVVRIRITDAGRTALER